MSAAPSNPQTPAAPIADEILCPNCGYNLKTLTRKDCPECGTDIDFVREQRSQIPWVYRDEKGRIKAYWQTVWMVIKSNETFCLELTRPVSYRDANRFRWATILWAYIPFLPLTAALFMLDVIRFETEYITYATILNGSIFTALVMGTAAPYYALSHKNVPPERLNRAATLTLYACAPLAFMPFAIFLLLAGVLFTTCIPGSQDVVYYTLAGGMALLILAMLLTDLNRILQRMLEHSGSAALMTFKVLVACVIAVFAAAVGIPLIMFLVALIYFSV